MVRSSSHRVCSYFSDVHAPTRLLPQKPIPSVLEGVVCALSEALLRRGPSCAFLSSCAFSRSRARLKCCELAELAKLRISVTFTSSARLRRVRFERDLMTLCERAFTNLQLEFEAVRTKRPTRPPARAPKISQSNSFQTNRSKPTPRKRARSAASRAARGSSCTYHIK